MYMLIMSFTFSIKSCNFTFCSSSFRDEINEDNSTIKPEVSK